MKPVLAWALFDFANTFFAIAMLSFYFPLWVVEDQGAKELLLSLALGISMACVALIMPFCGALSDEAGERVRFLRWTTYGCTMATFLIGWTNHLGLALTLFGIANICYQLGTVFYDALLWKVAPTGRLGQTSAVGAAFGYLGSLCGLLLLWPFVHLGGHRAAFIPSAVFFFLFALPSFLVIRESPVSSSLKRRYTAGQYLVTVVRSAKAIPGLWRYLWAAFFSSSAINTILLFMAIYTKKVMGFSESEMIRFFLFSQVFSVMGSLTFGRLIARWGAKRTLTRIWGSWIVALGLVAVSPSVQWLWIGGPLIGFCLGATWSTSRVLIIELSPKHQLAEIFGLAGLFARVSSIFGPLLWGLLVWDPSRYHHAILSLIGLLGVGLWLLRRVPSSRVV